MPPIFFKIEKYLFYLLLFSVPFEIKKFLWQWGRFKVEWTSGFLWASDILIAVILVLWLVRILRSKSRPKLLKSDYPLLSLLGVALLSAIGVEITAVSIFQIIKLAEFIAIFFYVRCNFEKVFSFTNSLLVIVSSAFVQSLTAIGQLLNQSGLGLWFLGESPIASADSAGAAAFLVDSVKFLRAYGTTPHPNLLAAFLFVAIFASYWIYLSAPNLKEKLTKKYEIFGLVCYGIILWAFFGTFSRTIIGLWLLGIAVRTALILFMPKFKEFIAGAKKRFIRIGIVTCVVAALFCLIYWPQVKVRAGISLDEGAVTERIYFAKIAEEVSKDKPFLGVGIGQFVPEFMKRDPNHYFAVYQPVHNIYLLISSEMGFIGLGLFIAFLIAVWRGFIKGLDFKNFYHYSFVIFAASIFVMGLFDHFLWTLQIGRFILWLTLGFITARIDMSGQ